MNIKMYKGFCNLSSGLTLTEYNLEYAKVMQLDLSKYTNEDIIQHRKDYINNLISSKKSHEFIRIGKTYYKVDRELYKLTLLQWSDFDAIMRSIKEDKIYNHIDEIVSIFLRPCRFYKWFPKKYNQKDRYKIKDIANEQLDIRIALEMTNFFFSMHNDFYNEFGNKLFRSIGKGSLGTNKRLDELYIDYGWYLTIKNLSGDIFDFTKVMEIDMGTVISWLELSKAHQEIDYIYTEMSKKNMKLNG